MRSCPRLLKRTVAVCLMLLLLTAVVVVSRHGPPAARAAKVPRVSEPVNTPSSGQSVPEEVAWTALSDDVNTSAGEFEIRSLFIGPAGSIWIVKTNDGVTRFAGGRFWHYGRQSGLPHDQVFSACPAGRGVLVGTREGLVWINDFAPDAAIPAPIHSGSIPSVFPHGEHLEYHFLVATPGADPLLGRFLLSANGAPPESGQVQTTTLGAGFTNIGDNFRRLLPGDDDNLYAFESRTNQWYRFAAPKEFEQTVQETDFQKVAAAMEPIDSRKVGGVTTIQRRNGISHDASGVPLTGTESVLCWAIAGNGEHLWVGEQGLLTQIDLDDPSPARRRRIALPRGGTPTAVVEDLSGRIWVATKEFGLLRADTKQIQLVPRIKPLPSEPREAMSDEPATSGKLDAASWANSPLPPNVAGFTPGGSLWGALWNTLVMFDADAEPSRTMEFPGNIRNVDLSKSQFVETTEGIFAIADVAPADAPNVEEVSESLLSDKEWLLVTDRSPEWLALERLNESRTLLGWLRANPQVKEAILQVTSDVELVLWHSEDALLNHLEQQFGRQRLIELFGPILDHLPSWEALHRLDVDDTLAAWIEDIPHISAAVDRVIDRGTIEQLDFEDVLLDQLVEKFGIVPLIQLASPILDQQKTLPLLAELDRDDQLLELIQADPATQAVVGGVFPNDEQLSDWEFRDELLSRLQEKFGPVRLVQILGPLVTQMETYDALLDLEKNDRLLQWISSDPKIKAAVGAVAGDALLSEYERDDSLLERLEAHFGRLPMIKLFDPIRIKKWNSLKDIASVGGLLAWIRVKPKFKESVAQEFSDSELEQMDADGELLDRLVARFGAASLADKFEPLPEYIEELLRIDLKGDLLERLRDQPAFAHLLKESYQDAELERWESEDVLYRRLLDRFGGEWVVRFLLPSLRTDPAPFVFDVSRTASRLDVAYRSRKSDGAQFFTKANGEARFQSSPTRSRPVNRVQTAVAGLASPSQLTSSGEPLPIDSKTIWIVEGYSLLRIMESSAERLPTPSDTSRLRPIVLAYASGNEKSPPGLVVLCSSELWYYEQNTGWRLIIRRKSSIDSGTVIGLLDLPNQDNALVGLQGGEHGLYHVKGFPHPKSKEDVEPVDDVRSNYVGLFNNAILRDSRQRIWVAVGNDGVYLKTPESEEFKIVPTKPADGEYYFHSGIEYPANSGKIWFANGGDGGTGLWLAEIDNGERLVQQVASLEWSDSVAAFPIKKGGEPQLWIGGQHLTTVDPDDPGNSTAHTHQYVELSKILGNDPTVKAMRVVGETLFVSCERGLAKFELTDEGVKSVQLTHPDSPESWRGEWTVLLARKDGSIWISVGSKLYRSPDEKGEFEQLAVLPFKIFVMIEAEGDDGEMTVVCGAENHEVYELRVEGGSSRISTSLLFTLSDAETPENITERFESVALLSRSRYVVYADQCYDVQWEGATSVKATPLAIPLTRWSQHVRLSDTKLVLLQDRDQTAWSLELSDNEQPVLEQLSRQRILRLVSVAPADASAMPKVYLLGEDRVWQLDSDSQTLNSKVASLPSEVKEELATGEVGHDESTILRTPSPWPDNSEVSFAADERGFWLAASQGGLWRYDGSLPWRRYDEYDGLPSNRIRMIVPLGPDRVTVFTSNDFCHGARGSDGDWQFTQREVQGIDGDEVKDSLLFDLEGGRAIAMVTENGINIAYQEPTAAESELEQWCWAYITPNTGLLDPEISTLRWDETNKELWVGGRTGVTSFRLEVQPRPNGKPQVTTVLTDSLTHEQGLSPGNIVGIRIGRRPGPKKADPLEDVWVLTTDGLTRWTRSPREVVSSVSHVMKSRVSSRSSSRAGDEGKGSLQLGPVIDGRPPEVLFRDFNNRWAVWRPPNGCVPKLKVRESFFWHEIELEYASLDPKLQSDNHWTVRFSVDHPGNRSFRGNWFIQLGLFLSTGEHFLIAEVTGTDNNTYITSQPIQFNRSFRYYRMAVLLVALTVGAVFVGRSAQHYAIRRRNLRKRRNPYIVGGAISDPKQFFGRKKLVTTLANNVALNSYALLGQWRIGKTSIQRILANSLETHKAPDHTFLPIYVDLQQLGEDGDPAFFHFLADHIVEHVKRLGVPPAVLERLKYQAHDSDENINSYKARQLVRDLKVLSRHLSAMYQPRVPSIVLQIDESSFLHAFRYDTLLGFRSIFFSDLGETKITTVLSGKSMPPDPVGKDLSPWSNFISRIEVEPLTPREVRELIVVPATQILLTFDSDVIERITARSEGKPLVVQELCSNVLEYRYTHNQFSSRVTMKQFENSLAWKPTTIAVAPEETE